MNGTDPRGRSRARLAAIAVISLAAIVCLLAGSRATAGTYRATQCNSSVGAGFRALLFHRTSSHYVAHSSCKGEGLTIRHREGNHATRGGRYGSWTLNAPKGARIVRARVRIAGQGRSGHRPKLVVGTEANKQVRLGRITDQVRTAAWSSSTGATSLSASLRCVRHGHCGEGKGAVLALHRINLLISDVTGPALGLGGSIFEGGARRGRQPLAAIASDSGGGVHRVAVEVNGRTVAAKPNRCAVRGNFALRPQPCPEHVVSSFVLRTASSPFRQGLNDVRVCASDFARDSTANRRCSHHHVRIDNRCPLSGRPAADLSASFAGGRNRITVPSNSRARVGGRLSDTDGNPVSGAVVCIASTTRGERFGLERVVATPSTDAQGRFHARLPKGPNRAIRIANWPDGSAALERRLLLGSKAIPKLRLRPKRTIRNGKRVRFSVALPSPSAGHRRVEVQARSGHRWIRVARGRTGANGSWHGSYRFRATTGTRRYAFRAIAPHSKGYPFQPGHSKIRHARVKGR